MGRPINYKKIGGNTSQDGNQLLFSAWFTGEAGPEDAWVVKQVAKRKFRLAAVADATRQGVFTLSDAVDAVGDCVLAVTAVDAPQTVSAVAIAAGGDVSDADGDYTVTVVGGTFTEAATLTVTVDTGEVTAVVVLSGGVYSVAPTNPVSVTGLTVDSAAPTFNLTFAAIPESTNRILKHRVATFEGNMYKYDVDIAASEAGEADVATA
jgi:hypothetical protein